MERRTVLEARNLCRFFHSEGEETCALRGVDLEVRAGEMVAVVGPSGSGKSTLLGCLAGIDEPDGGEVRILEQRLTRLPEQQRSAIRARYLGFLLQSDNLIDHLTVEENVLLPVHLTCRGNKQQVMTLLEALGLIRHRRAYPGQLSGGEAARAGLAVALAASPKILLAGNFVENEIFHPKPVEESAASESIAQMFGDLWEWTSSSYSPYPGYATAPGALGEYNGKFMCNQYVLRGGSCATSQSPFVRPIGIFSRQTPVGNSWEFV
jgi:putative ABC transport system ATP-binding protein